MIKKILVANRGEIAVRILRTCREMGISSVAVFSDADKDALFSDYADEAFAIGPAAAAQSYLNIPGIIQTAKQSGADAIHPGYGFLAENPQFAAACEEEGIRFIGPSSKVLELAGDKIAARREMSKAGIPVVPGTNESILDPEQARSVAREIGYPVIIKPSGGGGGIGMTIAGDEAELVHSLRSARAIAHTTFGMDAVYIEKYLPDPRHIEFQILADSAGSTIHLGERECSIQRRHQKLIEESPSPVVTPALRAEMGAAAIHAARCLGYEGAGTVEFLFADGKFYFLEINARIQVEHPVTEMVTGIDIVNEQIRIAAGIRLGLRQEDVRINGCALECRINAEDPFNDFKPAPGKITTCFPPGGNGIRVDSGILGSSSISPFYDPMVAKLIAWGRDRGDAIGRMRRALYEYVLVGIQSNIPFHRAVMENERFIKGELSTHFIAREASLLEDMKRIAEQRKPLQDKVSHHYDDKKKMVAVAVAAAMARRHGGSQ